MPDSPPDDAARWDARYASADPAAPLLPAPVLADNRHLLPTHGTALDLACGLGANALVLARAGLEVHAWDLSPQAIARLRTAAHAQGLDVRAVVRDAIAQPPAADSFDVIVVARFLERSLAPQLVAALRTGGLLFYQTFTRTRLTGRGPQRDAWRLAEGELLALFDALRPVVYREEGVLGDASVGLRDEAIFIGCKR